MKTSHQHIKIPLPDSIIRQAIAWRIRLESASQNIEITYEEELLACKNWRARDATHELAWQRLEKIDSNFQTLSNNAPKLAQSTLLKTDTDCQHINRRQALRSFAGSALSLSAIGLISHQQGLFNRIYADYSTQNTASQYTLEDNSHVWLNSDTSIELDFNHKYRSVKLTQGEIQLTVASDPRPLNIITDHGLLTTSDAQFLLRNESDHSLLQVTAGSVMIKEKRNQRITQAVTGTVYQINSQNMEKLNNQVFNYSSWVEGIFSVKNMPLKDFLAELSRYRTGFLKCDPRLNQHLVSGIYQLHDTDLVIQTLALSVKGEVRYRTRWWAEITPLVTS